MLFLPFLTVKVGPFSSCKKRCDHDYKDNYTRISYGNDDTYRKCSWSHLPKAEILIRIYQNYYHLCYAIKPNDLHLF